MAEPKLLISDEDWQKIQELALKRKVRGQVLIREAVLNWLHGETASAPIAKPPADLLKSLHHIHSRLARVTAELHRLIATADRRDDGSETVSDSKFESLEGELARLTEEVGAGSIDKGRGGGVGKNADSANRKTAGRMKQKKPVHLIR